jgi:hypothetical protein
MNYKKIQEELSEALEMLEELDKHLDKNFMFEGKTRRQWRRELLIEIPEDPTFRDIVRLSAKLATNYQLAAFHRDNQTLTIDVLSRTRDKVFEREYQRILDEYMQETGKRLAAESCRMKACVQVEELDSAINAKKILKEFWAKTCEELGKTRKSLETIAMALGSESKIQREFVVKTGER